MKKQDIPIIIDNYQSEENNGILYANNSVGGNMNRKDTTTLVTETLIRCKMTDRKYYAREVTFDYGTEHPKRVDVMQFVPNGTGYASDIEKGEFICYEVKSSYEDLYSGNGLNFFGEKNYIVTTMELAKRIQADIREGKIQEYIKKNFPESSLNFGIIAIIPSTVDKHNTSSLYEEWQHPTELDLNKAWQTYTLTPCNSGRRTRGIVEMLFCMLRSKHSATNYEDVEVKYG